jgi:hypothetical protein
VTEFPADVVRLLWDVDADDLDLEVERDRVRSVS